MRNVLDGLARAADRVWRPLLVTAALAAVVAGALRAAGLLRPSTLAVYAVVLLCAAAVPLGLLALRLPEPVPAVAEEKP